MISKCREQSYKARPSAHQQGPSESSSLLDRYVPWLHQHTCWLALSVLCEQCTLGLGGPTWAQSNLTFKSLASFLNTDTAIPQDNKQSFGPFQWHFTYQNKQHDDWYSQERNLTLSQNNKPADQNICIYKQGELVTKSPIQEQGPAPEPGSNLHHALKVG